MLTNTVPCTFWVVLDVFSSPNLLQDLRDEFSTVMIKSSDNDGTVIHKLNLARMRDKCLLPSAIFQETLRTRSTGSSIRSVRQDFHASGPLSPQERLHAANAIPNHPRKRKPIGQGRKGVTTLDALSKRDKPPSSRARSAALAVARRCVLAAISPRWKSRPWSRCWR